MTIEEAISHIDCLLKNANLCPDCKEEHRLLKKWLEENIALKKEKCELLGIIQQKDKLINKMKNCDNCKHRLKVLEMEVLDLDKDELREPCNVCNNYDKWEIIKE